MVLHSSAGLQCIASRDIPVPVPLGILIQGRKHDGKNNFHVIADEIAEVFVVPEVQCALRDLEVWTSNRLGELMEKGFLNLGELGWVHDLEDVLNFIEEHDFLRAVDFWPVAKEAQNNLNS